MLNAVAGLMVLLMLYYQDTAHGITTAPIVMKPLTIAHDGMSLMFYTC